MYVHKYVCIYCNYNMWHATSSISTHLILVSYCNTSILQLPPLDFCIEFNSFFLFFFSFCLPFLSSSGFFQFFFFFCNFSLFYCTWRFVRILLHLQVLARILFSSVVSFFLFFFVFSFSVQFKLCL